MAPAQTDLVFAPLGGVGEIGMNLSLYGVGQGRQRKWLIVDLGVSFASEDQLPGVDLILPDIGYIAEEKRDLVGIVLTHAHEDHFGAVLDLWPRLKVPVYATPFTAALLEAKRRSEPGAPEVEVKIIPVGGRFTAGPFDVELVSVAHSIPESNALIIRTPAGTVLHTGDWKIDPTPVLGPKTDEAKLRALGDEGCLALIGDSTNAVREGRSPSEQEVGRTITDLIRSARGRVAVTTFASNVGRLKVVAEAARACGREVVVVGRAMERVVQVARETGNFEGVQDFRSQDAYGYLPPDKVVALCTGSQGEARAALARIAADQHPEVTLSRGDRVIVSARTIPGNEKAVGRVLNGLIEQGIEVITDRTHLVHVSGHPRRDELTDMISWVKPKILIPVHGEALHLSEHAALARSLGVPEVISCRNGDVVKLSGVAGVIDEIPAGRFYKDGKLLVDSQSRTVADRRRLSFAGVVSIALALDERGELVADPEYDLIGLPERDAEGKAMADVIATVIDQTIQSLPRQRRRDPDSVGESVRRAVRSAVAERWGKKPMCHVHVLPV
ncbi:MAG: ribonuclease J [Rhizobiales bacterium]|nr:ribonuclease J [Hyphomicrobiales bacterium]OJY46709.1 MAG: MBL fold metallo-hydrolase [Rhizobiales bacterium 64-17]